MKRIITISLFFALATLVLSSCHGDPPMVGAPSNGKPNINEHLINANRTIAQSEETAIDQYIARRKWPMVKLREGTRMWEYERGEGAAVNFEDSICVEYSIEAINGKLIYDNTHDCFVAGRRMEMPGLDEAVLHLRHGSKAKVIIPSSMGFGIGGDGDRIPQSTILVLDVTVK